MIAYPPPTGDRLTPAQQDAVREIKLILAHNAYDQSKLQSVYPDLVSLMTAACSTPEEKSNMYGEIGRYVRWTRLPGYYLSHLFQQFLHQSNSIEFIGACRLYAEAQITLNHDLALSSLETGLLPLAQALRNQEHKELQGIADDFRQRLRLLYRYYRHWYSSRSYTEINPLSEHLYTEKTRIDLSIAFSELDKPEHQLSADDYLNIITRCQHEEDHYSTVVARRFLGHRYAGKNEWNHAEEQYRLGLDEALAVSLETEIGHFHRHYGYALYKTGQLGNAVEQFEKACAYESHPLFDYWSALSLRELGDAKLRLAQQNDNPETFLSEIESALHAYQTGRSIFDRSLGMGVLPVARAVKQQMFRSYTGNVLQALQLQLLQSVTGNNVKAATVLLNINNTLAEIEAAGPRYATELVAEGKAITAFSSTDQKKYRQARAIFHEELGAFSKAGSADQDFEKYLDSIMKNRPMRRWYMEQRIALTPSITHAQLSDEITEKIMALPLPKTLFLLFYIDRNRIFARLLDFDARDVKTSECFYNELELQSCHETYKVTLQESISLPSPSVGVRLALDKLLGYYDTILTLLLEPFLPCLQGKHLKIFPRLFLNDVPLHAVTIKGKPLHDYCSVSYAQTLGLLLQVHQKNAEPSARTLTMIGDKGAPRYQGTIRHIQGLYGDRLHTYRNPSWQDFATAIGSDCPTDLFFACHGQYNPDNPAESSLFPRTPEEISFSPLFSELDLAGCQCVTLGACESGLGRTLVTAEYLGLPIAFLAAGVRYVIGTLWKVNQLAAAILFSHYYELLHHGKLSVPMALNEAQRILKSMSRGQVEEWITTNLPEQTEQLRGIKNLGNVPFEHPYYWAGFYVTGDV